MIKRCVILCYLDCSRDPSLTKQLQLLPQGDIYNLQCQFTMSPEVPTGTSGHIYNWYILG